MRRGVRPAFTSTTGPILQIKMRIVSISPMIWRRVLLPISWTLEELDADFDEAGQGFRSEGGHHSDLKPARRTASQRIVVDDRDRGGSGQGAGSGAWRLRRLSPESSIR